MKRIFTLSKTKAVLESATDATDNPTAEDSGENQNLLAATFPLNTTNLRRDFVEQAKKLKEVVLLGKTPERVEKPKLNYTLDNKGFLKGDADLVKDTGTTATIDLVKRAEAVNEGVRRPVFKRKVSTSADLIDTPQAPIKDERESEDKQPKEAVACEARFPQFNKREQELVASGDPASVRAKMADGSLSKLRGKQILYTMGATEEAEDDNKAVEEIFATAPTDAGNYLDKNEEELTISHCCCPHGDSLVGIIDTEIGDDLGCDVHYISYEPVSGQIVVPDAVLARKINSVFESIGVKSHTVSAKEEFTVLFEEQQEVPVSTWYALVRDAHNKGKISQITITATEDAFEDQIRGYLSKTYEPENIVSISKEKF